ncbi:MAG TPA: V-type ATPase subunit, partial [Anaerolineae bacterium]|nr:V-type ATPase subunit [Anaerolineae bacterium]
MPSGYDYGNARLRAMRSRLLKEADYSNLLAKGNLEELINALAETPYKEDIEIALTRRAGVQCIFEAVRANLTRTLQQIRNFFEGEPGTLIDLLLRRWDRHNLLAILRGQSQEVSPETVLSTIVPIGQLDEVSLRELARQPGLRAVIDLMTTWQLPYATVLRRVHSRTGARPDLDQLELAL